MSCDSDARFRLDLLYCAIEHIFVARNDVHGAAFSREFFGNAITNALGCPGYDGGTALES